MATKRKPTTTTKSKKKNLENKPKQSNLIPVERMRIMLWTLVILVVLASISVLSMNAWCNTGRSGQPWLNVITNPLCPTRSESDLARDAYSEQQSYQAIREASEQYYAPTPVPEPTTTPDPNRVCITVPVIKPNPEYNWFACVSGGGNPIYSACHRFVERSTYSCTTINNP